MKLANALVAVCLLAPRVAIAADPPDANAAASSPSDVAKKAAFDALVDKANRAGLSGHLVEAADAYFAALEMQHHPIVSGRLGLILVKLGKTDRAAEQLHEAVVRGQGAPAWERQAVQQAYDKAKAMTTLVNVDISHAGTKMTYDGDRTNPSGLSGYWMFALPGEHTLRAKLDGYEEAVATFMAKPGAEIVVTLKLVPLAGAKLPELPAPTATPRVPEDARKFPPLLNSSNITTDPNYSANEDPFYEERNAPKPEPKKTGPRFSVSGGLVTVFGVASWNPAVGGVLGVGLRAHEHVSLGLEGRAAWLTTGVADRPISAMTAGGIFSACGHLRWFFGCGLGYAGIINVEPSGMTYKVKTISSFQPGWGARLGVELRVGAGFVTRGNIDFLRVFRGMQVALGDQLIVDQPPYLFSAQVNAGWEF